MIKMLKDYGILSVRSGNVKKVKKLLAFFYFVLYNKKTKDVVC